MADGRVREHLLNHAPLLGGVMVSAVVSSRALVVARGDLTTATALLATLTLPQAAGVVLVGGAITLLGLLLGTTFMGLIGSRRGDSGPRWAPRLLLFLGFCVPAGFVLPWDVAAFILLASIVARILSGRTDAAADRLGEHALGPALFAAGMLLFAILFLRGDEPWLPSETIGLKGGEQVVGYVIDENDRWTTVLTERDRGVVRVPTDDVVSREPCRATAPTKPPLLSIHQPQPHYTACPVE
jgi:hypothetical protein